MLADPQTMILYHASDLIWATRIKRTAEALDLAARPVRSLDMLDQRRAEGDPAAMIVDLVSADLGIQLIQHARYAEQPAGPPDPGHADPANPTNAEPAPGNTPARLRIVAFGPHVQRDLLQRARDAGADEVMPRGAFDRDLPDILLGLAGRA